MQEYTTDEPGKTSALVSPEELPTAGPVEPLTADLVEDVVRQHLDAEDLGDDVMLSVTCRSSPRCLTELTGQQLEAGFSARLAEKLSMSTGVEYRAAATVFSHVQAGSTEPSHATFASFYPVDSPRADAQKEVRQAVQAFKADLETDDQP